MLNPIEIVAYAEGLPPKDINGVAQVADYVSLKMASVLVVTFQQGAWAGGTPAVTLFQATNVAGAGEKALSFDKKWTKVGLAAGTFAKTDVTADTFNLPNVANTTTKLHIQAATLDTDNGFVCVVAKVASPGANADLLSVHYDLFGTRYEQAVLFDPTVD